MIAKRPSILALDLEGTLISDAFSCFARPVVRPFLDWTGEAFDQVVIYTAVPAYVARQVLEMLVEEGEAPDWFANLELFHPVEMDGGRVKDLAVFGPLGTAVLVDDWEGYVLEDQKQWWVGVPQFTPHDECESDRELENVRRELERRYLGGGRKP